MQLELRQLQRRLGITTVMVTHDQDEALTMADRIAIMRDGRIEQVGSPSEVYQRPVSRFIASFLGAANFFRGKIVAANDGRVRIAVPGGLALSVFSTRKLGDTVTVALRPEAVRVQPAGNADEARAGPRGVNATRAIVEQIVYHGFNSHLYLRQPDGEKLIAFQQNEAGLGGIAIKPGTPVQAYWARKATISCATRQTRARLLSPPYRDRPAAPMPAQWRPLAFLVEPRVSPEAARPPGRRRGAGDSP